MIHWIWAFVFIALIAVYFYRKKEQKRQSQKDSSAAENSQPKPAMPTARERFQEIQASEKGTDKSDGTADNTKKTDEKGDETADDEQDDERQCAPSIHSVAAVEAASRRVDGHCLCRCTAPQCGEQHHSCHFLFHSLVVMIVLRVPVQVCSVLLLLLFLLFFGDSVQKMEESES